MAYFYMYSFHTPYIFIWSHDMIWWGILQGPLQDYIMITKGQGQKFLLAVNSLCIGIFQIAINRNEPWMTFTGHPRSMG